MREMIFHLITQTHPTSSLAVLHWHFTCWFKLQLKSMSQSFWRRDYNNLSNKYTHKTEKCAVVAANLYDINFQLKSE